MNIDREAFYNDTAKFFELGVLKEIYVTDSFNICNIANQCYGCFPYVKASGYQAGTIMTLRQVKEILANNNMYGYIIKNMDEQVMKERTIVLNEKMLNVMLKFKERNDLNPTQTDIDYQMEEELLSKNNRK